MRPGTRGSCRRDVAACRSAARASLWAPRSARRTRCRTSPPRGSRVGKTGRSPGPSSCHPLGEGVVYTAAFLHAGAWTHRPREREGTMKTVLKSMICCVLGTLLLGSVDDVRAETPKYGPKPQRQGSATWRASLAIGAFAGPDVVNGGFETGDFTGWTVVDQTDSSGSWFVYSGTESPFSAFPIAAPPQGQFGATS